MSTPTPAHMLRLLGTFLVLLGTLAAGTAGVKNEKVLKIGVILPLKGPYPWILPKTRPAIEIAVDSVRNDSSLLPGMSIETTYMDSHCSDSEGPLAAIDMYVKGIAHVFLGPACKYAIASVARFSPRWNIPVISAGALVSAFEDKKQYRLLTRILGSYMKIGEFFTSICDMFAWRTVTLVYDDYKSGASTGKSDCYFQMEGIFWVLKKVYNQPPEPISFEESKSTPADFVTHLKDASLNSRVVVLCASPDSIREIMIKAHELNFDNGEYVFFNIDLFSSVNASGRPWHREDDTEERNRAARKAYEALMTITLRKPTSQRYQNFSAEVKRRAKEMYPNFTYGEEEVNSFVGAFHDAVLLYALALNETLEANGNVSDGENITQRMWNRTFRGITGTVSIDSNGDRNADYSLLDLNPDLDRFEVVANYYGNRKLYEPLPGRTIHWAGGRTEPPLDTPKCGFDGTKCPPDEPFPEYGIVIIVLGSILIIVLIVTIAVYRRRASVPKRS